MKRLMLPLVAAVLLAGAASNMLRSHAQFQFGQNDMPSIQDLQSGQANSLPEQEMQDRSVLFAKEPAR